PRDEQQSYLRLTTIPRPLKRRIAGFVLRVDVGAAVYQSVGNFRVSSSSRHMQRSTPLGVAGFIHMRACLNKRSDNIATADRLTLVSYAIERSVSASGSYIGISARAKQQLDKSRVSLRSRVMKQRSAVPVMDTGKGRIGYQLAFDIFNESFIAARKR